MIGKRFFKPYEGSDGQQIIFFDGVCGLCNKTVDLLLSLSAGHELKFAPLQGETARSLLSPDRIADLDSVVYWRAGDVLTKSSAVLTVLRDVGGLPALASVFLLIPRSIRDFFYDVIASNRYALFGRRDACRMPSPEERARFLN